MASSGDLKISSRAERDGGKGRLLCRRKEEKESKRSPPKGPFDSAMVDRGERGTRSPTGCPDR